MEPFKVESFDPRWRNVHLQSIYNEAEEFDVGQLLRKCITLSSLHKLLLGQEPFVPSWLAVDGDTKDPAFWIEVLTEASARPTEHICAGVASFHDLLEGQSQALCAWHALAHLRKNQNPDSHSEVNPTLDTNGKRPRCDTNGPPLGNPRSAGTSPKFPDKPKLTLKKWREICERSDEEETSWKDIHAKWNQMMTMSKAAKPKSWDNLQRNWPSQGLALI